MRLVVDTNIILSALLSSESKAFELLSDVPMKDDKDRAFLTLPNRVRDW